MSKLFCVSFEKGSMKGHNFLLLFEQILYVSCRILFRGTWCAKNLTDDLKNFLLCKRGGQSAKP